MRIRDWVNQTPMVAIVLALIIATSLVVIVMSLRGERTRTMPQVWFYDLQAEKLFAADADLVPPTKAPSGGEGVMVKVFACGSCREESQRQIAYLERYSPDAKERREALVAKIGAADRKEMGRLREQLGLTYMDGLQRSRPGSVAWRSPSEVSPDISRMCPDGQRAQICLPANSR